MAEGAGRSENRTSEFLAGPWRATRGGALSGATSAPGDKSISHRALIFGALADGETNVAGLLEGDDVLRTAAAMRALGADIERNRDGAKGPAAVEWRIAGRRWSPPDAALYFGNSGTGCRLVMGAVAGAGVDARFDGDGSLRARPMGRIAEPLRAMGAIVEMTDGRLPLGVSTPNGLAGVAYELPVASAQVKSAALLAGLGAAGETIINEPTPSRDHTERMLAAFGVRIDIETTGAGRRIRLDGGQKLTACNVVVPGDPSSAAFPVVAALIVPGSDVLVRNVLVNPLRAGVFETLIEMGADISLENRREAGGEPVADIRARHSGLKGVAVPARRAPSMIDEYPILAVAAAFADGDTYMPGIEELRVKETDRIDATEAMLKAAGVETDAGPDWMRVCGKGGAAPAGGGRVETRHDHRIAMSALVLGLATRRPVEIDDAAMIGTSFPNFAELMRGLGADLAPSG
ncbi:MAG: 3-phosphoshikimate 1-carboxyvinyltransferase [Alphaproteobacteria bacterium]|nr:3-phosphoshikimate 1-carboxyvinyltransferase [Alphaproteobacteria bacterium]